MATPVLNYGKATSRRGRRTALALVISVILAWGAFELVREGLVEIGLRRRAQQLLSANKPAVAWSRKTIDFLSSGELVLPDGTRAQLADVVLPESARPNASAAAALAVQRLRITAIGHTVVGTAPDGTPLVQIWVLSPVAYEGMCGNSSHEERRRGAMLVWRNLPLWLCDNGDWQRTMSASNTPISVLGYR